MNTTLRSATAWHELIGRFLMNFGIVDRMVFELLHDAQPEGLSERQRDEGIEKRWNLLIERLPQEAKERAILAAHEPELGHLRRIRNQMAHGFLVGRLAPDLQSVTQGIVQAKGWDRSGAPDVSEIGYEELWNACDRLDVVIEGLQQTAGYQESCADKGWSVRTKLSAGTKQAPANHAA